LTLAGKKILLVVAGGIAAYKCPDLVRRLRERGATVRCVMTKAAAEFVTPLSLAALSEADVATDLFSLTNDHGMNHIHLTREADLVLVAPATANLMAKMAHGIADDLPSSLLLASNKPILIAPAMNVFMWQHPATQANLAVLEERGVARVGPGRGELACNETGEGRMADIMDIVAAVESFFVRKSGPLSGRRAIVTSGPTHEPIDPVRYIANRSSGRQGHAIAKALAELGADVTLVSGPVTIPDPAGVTTVKIVTAREMLAAVENALPADIAVCAAAVADWHVLDASEQKRKKGASDPVIALGLNPDILATLSSPGPRRPRLVVVFAAETEKLVEHAQAKLARKGCDLILANDVSSASGTFGGAANAVTLVSDGALESWPSMDKEQVARKLALHIARILDQGEAS